MSNNKKKENKMSSQHVATGSIKKVDFGKGDFKSWSQELIKTKFPDYEYKDEDDLYDTFRECICDYDWPYVVHKTREGVIHVFEKLNIVDVVDDSDFLNITETKKKGVYSFSAGFYDGGTCLDEVLEDAVKRIISGKGCGRIY